MLRRLRMLFQRHNTHLIIEGPKLIRQNVLTYEEDETRSRKPRNVTEKGATCKLQTLKERRRKINRRVIRKYSTIKDLLLSSRNAVIDEEELQSWAK